MNYPSNKLLIIYEFTQTYLNLAFLMFFNDLLLQIIIFLYHCPLVYCEINSN